MKSIFQAFLVLTVCSMLMIFLQYPTVLYNTYDCFACTINELSNTVIEFYNNNSSQIYLFTLTFFGSLLVPIFSPNGKSERTSVPFLRLIFPNKSEAFYNRIDICITVLVGTLLGFLVMHPTTTFGAIGAGAGWSTLLNRICKIRPKSLNDNGPNDSKGPHAIT